MSLNFIDVFSGAGGMSCGMEMTGMKCLLGIDIDKHAINTFKKNHLHAETFCGPIENLSETKAKALVKNQKIDLIVGGPPCQGFSTVGLGNPSDKRNSLFLEFVRLVKIFMPKFIVIENVTGLVAKKNEQTLKEIFNQFEMLGYNMNVSVLSAHQYGVPEKRRRTIIIGTTLKMIPTFPLPQFDVFNKKTFTPAISCKEALKDLEDKDGTIHNHELKKAQKLTKQELEILPYIPSGKGIRYKEDEDLYLPAHIRMGIDWPKLPEGRLRQTRFQRIDKDLPAPTIMTSSRSYYHFKEHRLLTVREAAKLQSFPNDFIFLGPNSSQWRQVGNAVPPLLGKAIALEILQMLKKSKSKKDSLEKKEIKDIRKNAFCYKKIGKKK